MEAKVEARITRRRFTVHEYHRMAEAGVLHEDDRVELIDGEVVEMNPIGSRHANCVREMNHVLSRRVGDDLRVDVQNPVRLDELREPQPDVMIIRARDYRDSLPTPEDVLIVIEVSDTTLAYDKNVKLPLYAEFGIPEAWIVDIESSIIERHTDPHGNGYRLTERAKKGESIASKILPSISIATDSILK